MFPAALAWLAASGTTRPVKTEPEHLSIVVCGHPDNGKSTPTARLIFDLEGMPDRGMGKLKAAPQRLAKGSLAFAFYMDRWKEERGRGVTIACTTTKE